MDRENLQAEMIKNLQQSGNVYLTEVATPGARPDVVNPDEVEQEK